MRLQQFINEIEDCGWLSTNDAQHTEIEKLWRKLFPVVADMQDEIKELEQMMFPTREGD